MSIVDWIADVLPRVEEAATRCESDWRSSMASLDAEAPSIEARESLRAVARSVRALHQPGLLEPVPMPIDSRSTRVLQDVRDAALLELEATWGESLRASLGPVPIPNAPIGVPEPTEVRATHGRTFEVADLVAQELGRPHQAPGWLWARVRDDVQSERQGLLRFRRNRRLVRWATAAALLVVTASLWPIVSRAWFPGSDDPTRPYDIEIISVEIPLDAATSTVAILRSALDGR